MLDDRPSGIVPPGKMALDAAYGIRQGTSVDNGEVWGAHISEIPHHQPGVSVHPVGIYRRRLCDSRLRLAAWV